MNQGKYDKDQPFADPVVRCDSCQKILLREDIRKAGMCKYCGNKKVRNVLVFSDEEREQMVEMQVDPDFLALFGDEETVKAVEQSDKKALAERIEKAKQEEIDKWGFPIREDLS